MNKYTITVTESDSGRFSINAVSKTTRVNQYKTISKPLAKNAFGFSDASDPQTLAKRAVRKSRWLQGGRKPPYFFMNKIEMLKKSSEFYKKQAIKILADGKKCKTEKEKKENLNKLISLRSKILFEIQEIERIIKESENFSDSDGDEWKDGWVA